LLEKYKHRQEYQIMFPTNTVVDEDGNEREK
jgi:hypothetical protein